MTGAAPHGALAAGDRFAVRYGAGSAAAVVVCEGGLAAPVELWDAFGRSCADAGRRVLVSERAGTCRAPRPGAPRRLDRLAHELSAFLAAEVGDPAVLVGDGFGGLVLMELARRRPDQVAALVLVDTLHPAALARSVRQRQGMARLETALLWEAARAAVGRPGADHGFERLSPAAARSARAALRAAPWTPRTALAELRAWKRSAPADGVPALPGDPPLAVVSSEDLLRGDPSHHRLQRELLGLSARARARCVPGARALLVPSALAEITAVVGDLAEHGRPARPAGPRDPSPAQLGGRRG